MHVRDVCNCRYSSVTCLVVKIVKLNTHIHMYCENQSRLVYSMLEIFIVQVRWNLCSSASNPGWTLQMNLDT